ncbi:2-dehydropantoate 2-reductase [Actinacidiphila yanglinensis]|uniref:2-dehydropantoate 2-reductase n=1 Tax=Actinacidiphila yanglinensis TaxID=310779 RepID=A0A1H5XTF3_9ACTN|nr:2-dehydropantoate 2-reductase N-terminal domain-containing protein [Actinacidiphila yanglinensis]SEG15079.1 2-dehydropantoate 2-reductase [Actinacidiphila yanglinensis]
MRYIIIGAGAVGGAIGGLLSGSGREVVLVARGPHLEALRAHGLWLQLADGERQLSIPAVAGPDELTPRDDDVLVLCVKTQHTPGVLDTWASYGCGTGTGARRGHGPAVVCAQNGVENERLALRRFADVYGMCVWLPSSFLEPGVVRALCTPLPGMLHLGRYPSGSDATARAIADDLTGAGFAAPVTDDVMAWKYAKLLANLVNAADAVLGPDEDAQHELVTRARAEGAAALAAAGIAYVGAEEQSRTRGDQVNSPPGNRSSTWQSLTRGAGSIESDYLNGEIVLLGRRFGVPTPVNEALRQAANRAARERRAPGDLSAGEREELLSAGR